MPIIIASNLSWWYPKILGSILFANHLSLHPQKHCTNPDETLSEFKSTVSTNRIRFASDTLQHASHKSPQQTKPLIGLRIHRSWSLDFLVWTTVYLIPWPFATFLTPKISSRLDSKNNSFQNPAATPILTPSKPPNLWYPGIDESGLSNFRKSCSIHAPGV